MTAAKPKHPVAFHPYLLAMFPVLFLYARNLGELDFGDVVYPLTAALALAGALHLALWYPVRSALKRGLMVSCLIAMIFAYANIVSALSSVLPLPAYRWAWPYYTIWLLITAVPLAVIARLDRSLSFWTKILNVIALCLVLLNTITIVSAIPGKLAVWRGDLTIPEAWQGPAAADDNTQRPNIFLLVFDQHVGLPCLERYGYDAGDFVQSLERRGFHVAAQSKSNYWMTPFAMACLLNYTYLDFVRDQIPATFKGLQPALKLTRDNRAFRFLKEAGYTTMQCHTDFLYPYENIDVVDIRFNAEPWYTTALSLELIGNTPLSLTTPTLLRRAILSAIDQTKKMALYDKPFVLFTHFLAPHPPHVFDEQGNVPGPGSAFHEFPVQFCADWQKPELRLYLAEMAYMHQQIIEMVDYIQTHSARPPVIIIQGDHGNRFQIAQTGNVPKTPDAAMETYSILNAMYLPGVEPAALGDAVSPVNTFRIIFDRYFGTDLGLLANRSFHAGSSAYEFRDVTPLVIGDPDAD
jgi:hypothetical protein